MSSPVNTAANLSTLVTTSTQFIVSYFSACVNCNIQDESQEVLDTWQAPLLQLLWHSTSDQLLICQSLIFSKTLPLDTQWHSAHIDILDT